MLATLTETRLSQMAQRSRSRAQQRSKEAAQKRLPIYVQRCPLCKRERLMGEHDIACTDCFHARVG